MQIVHVPHFAHVASRAFALARSSERRLAGRSLHDRRKSARTLVGSTLRGQPLGVLAPDRELPGACLLIEGEVERLTVESVNYVGCSGQELRYGARFCSQK